MWAAISISFVSFGGISASDQQQPVTMMYESFYPYMCKREGKEQGLVYDLVTKSSSQQGIKTEWVQTSYQRMMMVLERNTQLTCAVGYSDRGERADKYKFSREIVRIGDTVILTRKENEAELKSYGTIQDLISESSLIGGFPDIENGWSPANEEVNENRHRHVFYEGGEDTAVKLLNVGRVDYIYYDEKAARYMIDQGVVGDLYMHKYPGLRKGRALYLMCNQDFPSEMLERFNQAYAALYGASPYLQQKE